MFSEPLYNRFHDLSCFLLVTGVQGDKNSYKLRTRRIKDIRRVQFLEEQKSKPTWHPSSNSSNFDGLKDWVECSPMVRKTWVQSQVASYQRLLKWYLILPYLTLSNIRYVSRVKSSNPRKGVVPSPTPWRISYWKGSLLVALNYGRQLYN